MARADTAGPLMGLYSSRDEIARVHQANHFFIKSYHLPIKQSENGNPFGIRVKTRPDHLINKVLVCRSEFFYRSQRQIGSTGVRSVMLTWVRCHALLTGTPLGLFKVSGCN